ncbi:MAG: hypothetical protein E7F68_22070 [Clostridium butyricum]|nr:hypothetical protein [Clostridium butyricum]
MGSISKLSDKCEKCHYKDTCDNKRMVACAVVEQENNKLMDNVAAPLTNPLGNPMSNKVIPITIYMGEYGNIHTTMESIKEQVEKQLRIDVCSFNN